MNNTRENRDKVTINSVPVGKYKYFATVGALALSAGLAWTFSSLPLVPVIESPGKGNKAGQRRNKLIFSLQVPSRHVKHKRGLGG